MFNLGLEGFKTFKDLKKLKNLEDFSPEMLSKTRNGKVRLFLFSWLGSFTGLYLLFLNDINDHFPLKEARVILDKIAGLIFFIFCTIAGFFFLFCLFTKTWENLCDRQIRDLKEKREKSGRA
jgi:hypothetical protein